MLVDLDPALGMAEPDPEIQELLERSVGLNVGIDYLPGSLPIGAPEGAAVDSELAADVVWFDACHECRSHAAQPQSPPLAPPPLSD